MHILDKFLNNITMYRLLVYSLAILSALGIIFAFMGKLASTPTEMVISLSLLVVSAYVTDRVFAWFFKAPTNMESSLITSLILFLIVQPLSTPKTAVALVLVGGASSASKFILSYNNRHIFNPAAFAAAGINLSGLQATTWWIGNSVFWTFSLVLGLLIVRKIRRFPLFITFIVVSTVLQYFVIVHAHQALGINMKQALLASPLIFLSTFMLTEPATMPSRRNLQIVFAAIVAAFYVEAWKIGPLTIYPEIALLIGNIFAFIVSPKFKVRLQLKEIQKVSDRVYNYVFQPDRQFNFLPGQYMEWTLASVPYDSRGNRRTFTIASSPTETNVQLGIKYYEPASMYKAAFEQLEAGDIVYASQLAGNFTFKGKERKKLVFIAGGIGITPFRSMVKYVVDKKIKADIILFYIVSDPDEFAYVEELKAAREFGVKTIPMVTKKGFQSPGIISGRITPEILTKFVPDYDQRLFYISGPNVMVDSSKEFLRGLGVHRTKIKTDHFSGY